MPDHRSHTDPSTIIGADCTLKGELSYEGVMKIDGKVEGKITSKGKLVLGKGGNVAAEVIVGHAQIEGAVKGNVTATERLELAAGASLHGDVRTTRLAVTEGATLVGNCQVTPDAIKAPEKSAEFVVPMPATPLKK